MKRHFTLLLFVLIPVLVSAGQVTDDFNRDIGDLGDQWEPVAGSFFLQDNLAVNRSGERGAFGTGIACWKNVQLSDHFRTGVTVTVHTNAGSSSAGVAFNCLDADHYYALRISGSGCIQLIFHDGDRGLQFWTKTISIIQNHPYRIEVSSEAPFIFSGSVVDAESGEVLASFERAKDPWSHFKGGYAGLYSGSMAKMTYDDFFVESH